MGYDIVVIGAGLLGSIVSSLLASRGYSVLVVDKHAVGGLASSLSLGLVAPYTSVEEEAANKLLSSIRSCSPWIYRRIVVYHVVEGPATSSIEVAGVSIDGRRVEKRKGFIVDADAYAHCIVARAVENHGLRVVEGAEAGVVEGGVVHVEGLGRLRAGVVVVAAGYETPSLVGVSVEAATAVLAGFEKKEPIDEIEAIVDHETGVRMVVEGASMRIAWLEPTPGQRWASTSPAETTPKPPLHGVKLDLVRPVAHYTTPVTAPPEPVVGYNGGVVYAALPGLKGLTLSRMVAEKVAFLAERVLASRSA